MNQTSFAPDAFAPKSRPEIVQAIRNRITVHAENMIRDINNQRAEVAGGHTPPDLLGRPIYSEDVDKLRLKSIIGTTDYYSIDYHSETPVEAVALVIQSFLDKGWDLVLVSIPDTEKGSPMREPQLMIALSTFLNPGDDKGYGLVRKSCSGTSGVVDNVFTPTSIRDLQHLPKLPA